MFHLDKGWQRYQVICFSWHLGTDLHSFTWRFGNRCLSRCHLSPGKAAMDGWCWIHLDTVCFAWCWLHLLKTSLELQQKTLWHSNCRVSTNDEYSDYSLLCCKKKDAKYFSNLMISKLPLVTKIFHWSISPIPGPPAGSVHLFWCDDLLLSKDRFKAWRHGTINLTGFCCEERCLLISEVF